MNIHPSAPRPRRLQLGLLLIGALTSAIAALGFQAPGASAQSTDERMLFPGGGSSLSADLPGEWSGALLLDSVEYFEADGGVALIDPYAEVPELITYEGTDLEGRLLLGVERPAPRFHAVGTFVEHQLASLVQETIARSTPDGEDLSVSSVEPFYPEGGTAVFEPGSTREETISYSGIDEDENLLLNVERNDPRSHNFGVLVESEPNAEMMSMMNSLDEIDDNEDDLTEPASDDVTAMSAAGTTVFDRDFALANDNVSGKKHTPCPDPGGTVARPSGSDNVADNFNYSCSPHGWWDYGDPGGWRYNFNATNERQRLEILSSAVVKDGRGGGGDVGIHQTFKAQPQQRFRLKALINLTQVTRSREKGFRGRITLHFLKLNGSIIPATECNNRLYTLNSKQWVEIPDCSAPNDTAYVRANVRSRATIKSDTNRAVAGYGRVLVDRVVFERLS